MKLAPLSSFFALIAGSQAFAQNAVMDWLPIHAGDKWTYQHETRDATGEGPGRLEVHRWQTEETIIGSWTVPEGVLVGRQVRIVDGSPQVRGVDPSPAFLIRGDCLYRLGTRDWEASAHQLTPDFLKWLKSGEIAADFCFPLAVHKSWGAPHWGGIRRASEGTDWEVSGIKVRDSSAPDEQNTVHIASVSSYLGSGMTADIWFEKGVGVVREEEIHHGTIGEERTRLLRFQPVSDR